MFSGRWIKWIVTGCCCLALLAGCGAMPEEDSAANGEGKTITEEDILQDHSEEFSLEVSGGQQEISAVSSPSSESAETFMQGDETQSTAEVPSAAATVQPVVTTVEPQTSDSAEQPTQDEVTQQPTDLPISEPISSEPLLPEPSLPEPLPEPSLPEPSLPEFSSLPPLQAETPQTGGHIIAIDAGHQAKGNKEKEPLGPGSEEMKAKVSSGTRGVATGVYEYELNLTIAQALKTELEARGYTIVMIRDSHDVDISNKERAETANTSGAEIFLRIHANGSEKSSVQGTLTICNTAFSPYNPGIHDESLRLSQEVLSHMVALMGSKDRGVWETDTMSGINWCTIPVTIVEMGYMSNEEEDKLMQTADYQERIVQGIADGVDAYFDGADGSL